ncbi:hypothetical protein BDZ45DRAFT_669860 [Acephala macrosclerotiorum]|nr:hypothetical protein BDZ45DRAFT_669860 [Acephala macrosclerotiorum]
MGAVLKDGSTDLKSSYSHNCVNITTSFLPLNTQVHLLLSADWPPGMPELMWSHNPPNHLPATTTACLHLFSLLDDGRGIGDSSCLRGHWIDRLGDPGRYGMASEDDIKDGREIWTGAACGWYSKASDKVPTAWGLHQQLAILATSRCCSCSTTRYVLSRRLDRRGIYISNHCNICRVVWRLG